VELLASDADDLARAVCGGTPRHLQRIREFIGGGRRSVARADGHGRAGFHGGDASERQPEDDTRRVEAAGEARGHGATSLLAIRSCRRGRHTRQEVTRTRCARWSCSAWRGLRPFGGEVREEQRRKLRAPVRVGACTC